jgi:rod shape-determining protein MreC
MLESTTQLAREKAELQKKLEAAAREGAMREEEIRELVRLRRLLGLRESVSERSVAARVIGGDPSALFSTLVLDRGGEDGVREGQPVAAASGAVGRILSVGPDYAVCMWLCDPRSRIAAYVQRTRVLGVLAGTGAGCELRYLSAGDDVQVGDRILTAGRGSVFPKGILVGTVKELRKDGLSVSAVVVPSVNVRKLEEVLVIYHSSPNR